MNRSPAHTLYKPGYVIIFLAMQAQNWLIKPLDRTQLIMIEPLWVQLNLLHMEESPHFKEHFHRQTFSMRLQTWQTYADEDFLCLTVWPDDTTGPHAPLGYCISGVKTLPVNGQRCGEIESLFLSSAVRGKGLGDQLMTKSLAWLQEKNCQRIQVTVAYGHESMLDFYARFGLYPRLIQLESAPPALPQ